jgi:hypothetical protein
MRSPQVAIRAPTNIVSDKPKTISPAANIVEANGLIFDILQDACP